MERRRRDLADIEDHIARLNKTLEQLVSKLDRIQSNADETSKESSDKANAVQEIKKEIDQKKKELVEEIDRQKKRKPAFAVIPYSGANGTNRRPVYLECTKDGVLVQPEGLLISLSDLRPPYGPGNPLDAALRVLRLTYQQKDTTFGITQPPYPLLIVRPDGIQTYALAREAMSGWDDQFGYELIDGEMELKFPPSPPGLKEQLLSTVDMAKKRQQALIASLPRRIAAGDREDNWDAIDASNAPNSSGSDAASTSTGGSNNALTEFSPGGGQQSEWQLIQGMASSQVSNAIQRNGMANGNAGTTSNPGTPGSPGTPGFNQFGMANADLSGQFTAGNASPQQGVAGAANAIASGSGTNNGQGQAAQNGAQDLAQANGQAGPNEIAASAGSGSAQGSQAGAGPSGTGPAASNATNGANGANGSASNTPSPPGANAFSSGTATGGGSGMAAGGAAAQSPADGSQSPNVSLSVNQKADGPATKAKHVRPEGDLKPISVSAGHGWAASRAEGKSDPCLALDRADRIKGSMAATFG